MAFDQDFLRAPISLPGRFVTLHKCIAETLLPSVTTNSMISFKVTAPSRLEFDTLSSCVR